MPKKNGKRFMIAALGVCVLSSSARAQLVDPTVYDEIARSLRSELSSRRILLEPSTLDPSATSKKPLSSAARTRLSTALPAETANLSEVIVCKGKPDTCRFLKGDAIIAVGEPRISGDTVRINVYYALKSTSTRAPVSHTDLLLVLVRRSGRFQLVERVVLGIS
jgi:hypothetical protein